jgi:hypothetical protein
MLASARRRMCGTRQLSANVRNAELGISQGLVTSFHFNTVRPVLLP